MPTLDADVALAKRNLYRSCVRWALGKQSISLIRAVYPAVLVRLYEEPEKPGNALDFIKQYLGASVGVDVEGLRAVTASHQPSRTRCASWRCATVEPYLTLLANLPC